jgi:hypothetical protein
MRAIGAEVSGNATSPNRRFLEADPEELNSRLADGRSIEGHACHPGPHPFGQSLS